jgi:hypothetical protein
MIRDPISRQLQDEVLREVNRLSFIGASQDVGANTKKKSLYYRMSTMCKSGGLFKLSSDSRLIECQPTEGIEKKLVDLVSGLMEEQDQIVSEANKEKKMCRWVHDKTMCQLTVGTTKDSAYGAHTDCGFHHNHMISEGNSIMTDKEAEIFINLPSDGTMRVATLVLSTEDGPNASLTFTDRDSGKVVMSVDTSENCLHIQGFGCQRYLKHQVVSKHSCAAANSEEGDTKNGVRLVFSFRYSLDCDDKEIMSDIMNKDERISMQETRGDYTATGIIDAVESGSKPVGNSVFQASIGELSSRFGGVEMVNPAHELIRCGVGADSPGQIQSDTVPCDQTSMSESIKLDTTTFVDHQRLWTRVTSSPFLKALNRQKIRVRVQHTVPKKKGERECDRRKVHVNMGRAPYLHVRTNYSTGGTDEVQKMLEIGDVLTENAVREHYGIPRNERSSPPWSCVHAAMLNCIIVAQDYKNDYDGIRRIQKAIADGTFDPSLQDDLFWIGGSGGAPEDYGSRPVDSSQLSMEQRMARYVLPHNQSRVSNMNDCLLNLVQREGMVALFAHPIDSASRTGRDEESLQFLGHYTAVGEKTGHTFSDDEIVSFATNLPGVRKESSGRVKEALWLKAAGSIRVTFRFSGIDETQKKVEGGGSSTDDAGTPNDEWEDRKPRAVDQVMGTCSLVDVGDNHYRLKAGAMARETVGGKSCLDLGDTCSLDSQEGDGWKTGHLDLDGEIAQVQLGYKRKKKKKGKGGGVLDEFGHILSAADPIHMADDFVGGGNLGFILQEGPEDKKKEIGEKLSVSKVGMFSYLGRLSVGSAYQLTRRHMTKGSLDGIEKAGYLMPSREPKYLPLGQVIQRIPMPFPVRSYDLVTHFQRDCCASPHPDLFGHDDTAGWYGMPMMSEIGETTLKDIVITSLITRTTGRVEHLRDYLEYTREDNSDATWRRMFTASDCRYLPLFIAASSGVRDSAAAYLQSKSMTAWLSDQFKESIPRTVRASPRSYSLFLSSVEKQLDEFVEMVKGGKLVSREDVVKRMCVILQSSCMGNKEKESSNMFLAHQLIADMEYIDALPHSLGVRK